MSKEPTVKELLGAATIEIKQGSHMVGHVYSGHSLSKHVCGDLDRAFVHFGNAKKHLNQALAELRRKCKWTKDKFHDWHHPQCHPDKDVVKLTSDRFCPLCAHEIEEVK